MPPSAFDSADLCARAAALVTRSKELVAETWALIDGSHRAIRKCRHLHRQFKDRANRE